MTISIRRRKSIKRLFVPVLLMVLILTAMPLLSVDAGQRNFTAHLSGSQEVPPVDTKAQGQAKFQLNRDKNALSFRLNVANIKDVTASHLHMAPSGQNGPVVVTLFSGTKNGRFQGTLTQGTIESGDLQGPLSGQELEDLIEAIREGQIYVNVHTSSHPPGEIRGQVR